MRGVRFERRARGQEVKTALAPAGPICGVATGRYASEAALPIGRPGRRRRRRKAPRRAVPGDDRPVRAVGVAECLEFLGARRRNRPRQAVAAPDTEVAGRPHVEPAKLEEQEHIGRPWSVPPYSGQPRFHLLIAQPRQTVGGEDNGAVECFGGEIAHGRRLLARCDHGAAPTARGRARQAPTAQRRNTHHLGRAGT
jgi:hypothetical protein